MLPMAPHASAPIPMPAAPNKGADMTAALETRSYYPTEEVSWITAGVGEEVLMFGSDYPRVEAGGIRSSASRVR